MYSEYLPGGCSSRHGLLGVVAALAFTVAVNLHAQTLNRDGSPSQFSTLSIGGGGVSPGTFFSSYGLPTVTGSIGVYAQIAWQRGVVPGKAGGVILRAQTTALRARDTFSEWAVGRLTEFSLLGDFSTSFMGQMMISALSVRAGASVHAGAKETEPFTNALALAPVGEIGFAFLPRAIAERSHPVALTVDINITRLMMNGNSEATDGAVTRILAGVRVTP